MKRAALIAIAPFVVASCTSAKPLMAPSGAMGYKVWCEIPSQCYEKAAEVCPSGYTIEANEKDYHGLGDFDGNLVIVCKKPAATATEVTVPPSGGDKCVACEKIKSPR